MDGTTATMAEHWVAVAGGDVRVRRLRTSDERAATVLFVHGAFVNGHLWDGVVDALTASATPLDLVVPDLPLGAHHRPLGTGADRTLPGVGKILIDVLDALGVTRAVVVGNDSGGAITQYALGANPERFSGALLTPTETVHNFPPKYFRFLFPPLRLRLIMWSTGHLLRTNIGRRSPLTFGHLIKRPLTTEEARQLMGPLWTSAGARNDVRRFLKAAVADSAAMRRASERAAHFPAPVDVAWSAGERVFPDGDADFLARSYPAGRRVADVTGSGSLSPLDQPGQVADRLLALLARVPTTERP
jgi:pimeloyl-ACP methyl ester carboxylesterase